MAIEVFMPPLSVALDPVVIIIAWQPKPSPNMFPGHQFVYFQLQVLSLQSFPLPP